jgi:O-antigen/teichoic acid export membrane protein
MESPSAHMEVFSQFFLTAVVLICWTIWTARNDLIFKGIQPSLTHARRLFSSEMLLLMHRVKPSLANQFDQLIQTMV